MTHSISYTKPHLLPPITKTLPSRMLFVEIGNYLLKTTRVAINELVISKIRTQNPKEKGLEGVSP